MNTDLPAHYFDIIKYHTNTGTFAEKSNWMRIYCNAYTPLNKGYNPQVAVYACADDAISSAVTDEKMDLTPREEAAVYDLLDYCKAHNIELLVVASPYIISEYPEFEMKYNTLQEIVESYGYKMLDGNKVYEEVGLDLSVDMADLFHVNPNNAEKWTRYFGQYIKDNYVLADHRGEAEYRNWDEFSAKSAAEDEPRKQELAKMIEQMREEEQE